LNEDTPSAADFIRKPLILALEFCGRGILPRLDFRNIYSRQDAAPTEKPKNPISERKKSYWRA